MNIHYIGYMFTANIATNNEKDDVMRYRQKELIKNHKIQKCPRRLNQNLIFFHQAQKIGDSTLKAGGKLRD